MDWIYEALIRFAKGRLAFRRVSPKTEENDYYENMIVLSS